jgi:hypothetical protein
MRQIFGLVDALVEAETIFAADAGVTQIGREQ